MRDFSWTYFTKTGDVDAYMLYKEACASERCDAGVETEGETQPFETVQAES